MSHSFEWSAHGRFTDRWRPKGTASVEFSNHHRKTALARSRASYSFKLLGKFSSCRKIGVIIPPTAGERESFTMDRGSFDKDLRQELKGAFFRAQPLGLENAALQKTICEFFPGPQEPRLPE